MKNQLSKRIAAPLASLLALVLLAVAPAVAETEDTSLGDMLANAALELQVKTALLDSIGWDMLDVDVEAEGDHVVLMGEADDRASSELAKEVALGVDGVKTVDNKLALVERPSRTPVGSAVANAELEVKDALLESRVKTALIKDMGTKAFDIEVEAVDGTVSLRGTLDSESLESTALEIAENCDGVKKVIDLLNQKS